MQAKETSFLKFLRVPNQFRIPIFQRRYSWEEQHCDQLWRDVLRIGQNDEIPSHCYRNTLELETIIMTDEQILELGFKALVDKLGPVGMVRFIHQFQAGTGDYTKERQHRSNRLKTILSVLPKSLK